jgi:hypothetical protein
MDKESCKVICINPRVELPKPFPILLNFYIKLRLDFAPPTSNKMRNLSIGSEKIVPSIWSILKTITLL